MPQDMHEPGLRPTPVHLIEHEGCGWAAS
jgi:hypothetical protein